MAFLSPRPSAVLYKIAVASLFGALASGMGLAAISLSPESSGGSVNETFTPSIIVHAEAQATQDSAAAGSRLEMPLLISNRAAVIAEVLGLKGEENFGVLSAGVFSRGWFPNANTVVGAGVFWDGLKDSDGFSYSQIAISGEISRGPFTVRANGYIPVGNRVDESRSHLEDTEDFEGGWRVDRREAALGWDAELEVAIPGTPAWIEPSVAAGYYQFYSRDNDFSGVSARGSVRFWQRVTADLEWRSNASGLGQEWRAGLRVSLPFGRRDSAEPVTAAADGKGVVEPQSDGKSVKTFASGKAVLPPTELPSSVSSGLPRDFFQPMHRLTWPTVVHSTHSFTGTRREHEEHVKTGKDDPDCGCHSGPVLIYD